MVIKYHRAILIITIALILVVNLVACYPKNSPSSSPRTSSSIPVPPNAPSNLVTESVSQKAVELRWVDNSDNENGFRIYRNGTTVGSVATNVNTYQDTNLKPGTTYEYMIRAYNQAGESGACYCTVKTLNPPIKVTLDKIGVISDHDPFLKGAGDIYLYVAVSDGEGEPQLQRIPEEGVIKLKDYETTEIGRQLFYSSCVGGELKVVVIAFEQDSFGLLEKMVLTGLSAYLTGGYGAAEVILNLLQSSPSADEEMTGETSEDDFVGAVERIFTSAENWGIGSYNDVQNGDLRIWFTISSPTEVPAYTETATQVLLEDKATLNMFNQVAFESEYPDGISEYEFNEYGLYYSRLFSLNEGDTVSIFLISDTPICIENNTYDCENGLAIIAFRRLDSYTIRSIAAQVTSCEVDDLGNTWELSLEFNAGETGQYQISAINYSGKPVSCEYVVFRSN